MNKSNSKANSRISSGMRRENANFNQRFKQKNKSRISSGRRKSSAGINLDLVLNRLSLQSAKREEEPIVWDFDRSKFFDKNNSNQKKILRNKDYESRSSDDEEVSKYHDLEALKSDREAKWKKTKKERMTLTVQEFDHLEKEVIYEKEVNGVMKVYRKRIIPKKWIKSQSNFQGENEQEFPKLEEKKEVKRTGESEIKKSKSEAKDLKKRKGSSASNSRKYIGLKKKNYISPVKKQSKNGKKKKNSGGQMKQNYRHSGGGINMKKPKKALENPFKKFKNFNLSMQNSPRNTKPKQQKLPYIKTETSLVLKDKEKSAQKQFKSRAMSENKLPSNRQSKYSSPPGPPKTRKLPLIKSSKNSSRKTKDLKVDVMPNRTKPRVNSSFQKKKKNNFDSNRNSVKKSKNKNRLASRGSNRLSKSNVVKVKKRPQVQSRRKAERPKKNISVFQKKPKYDGLNIESEENGFNNSKSKGINVRSSMDHPKFEKRGNISKKNRNLFSRKNNKKNAKKKNLKNSPKKKNDPKNEQKPKKKVKFSNVKSSKIKHQATSNGLKSDDGDDPILNKNPNDLNHPSERPEDNIRPCFALKSIPNFFLDDPLNFIPKTKGGKRDDLSVTNQSFYSNLGKGKDDEDSIVSTENILKHDSEEKKEKEMIKKTIEVIKELSEEDEDVDLPEFKVIREKDEESLPLDGAGNTFTNYDPITKQVKGIAEKMVNLLNTKKVNPFDLAIRKRGGKSPRKKRSYGVRKIRAKSKKKKNVGSKSKGKSVAKRGKSKKRGKKKKKR